MSQVFLQCSQAMNNMNEENLLTLYPVSHDINATFINRDQQLTTIEYDRWANTKYNRGSKQLIHPELLEENPGLIAYLQYISTLVKEPSIIKKVIIAMHRIQVFDDPNILKLRSKQRAAHNGKYGYDPHYVNTLISIIKPIFPAAEIIFKPNHHYAHAACGYYQAPVNFEKCLIFSYDGSGDTMFQSRREPRTIKELKKLKGLPYNTGILFYANNFNKKYGIKYVKTTKPKRYGGPYTLASTRTKIKYPDGSVDFLCKQKANRRLAAPGKYMGYTAYGTPREDLVKIFKEWFNSAPRALKIIREDILEKMPVDEAADYAASLQHALEETVVEILYPIAKKKKVPIIITGGCALNVLVNQRVAETLKQDLNIDVFVCNNPNDAGLSQGMFLLEFPKRRTNLIYNGIPMMDSLEPYRKKYNISTPSSITDLVNEIKNGKIIGCAHDGSELGPRALGNRSIICKPDPGMKDILNAKIKFREWFRPFAPVCRQEDKDKYFDNVFDSPYMSFAPTVKPSYREKLKSITHIDNTARLQTVTREQHSFFYDILCEMENQGLIPVILNTSFNIRGKPILTRYSSAFEALETTDLDCLFLDKQFLIHKPQKDSE